MIQLQSHESNDYSINRTILYVFSIIYGVSSVIFFIPGVCTHVKYIVTKGYSSFLKIFHALKLQLGIFCLFHGLTFFFNLREDKSDEEENQYILKFGCKFQASIHISSLALVLSFMTSTLLAILILLSKDNNIIQIQKKVYLSGLIVSIFNWVIFALFVGLFLGLIESAKINVDSCRYSLTHPISVIVAVYTLLILVISLVMFFILHCKIYKDASSEENILSYKRVLRNWLFCEILIIIKFIFFFVHATNNIVLVDRVVEILTVFFINLFYVLGKGAFIEFFKMITPQNKSDNLDELFDSQE